MMDGSGKWNDLGVTAGEENGPRKGVCQFDPKK